MLYSNKINFNLDEVPTPNFHHWNNFRCITHHNLDNIDKAKDYFNVIKPLYGENTIDTLNEGMIMWNFKKIYDEEVTKILIDNYGFK